MQSVDGHDHDALELAYEASAAAPNQPSVVIANTVKGKGVSFMEHNVLWHYRSPQGDEYAKAISELEEKVDA